MTLLLTRRHFARLVDAHSLTVETREGIVYAALGGMSIAAPAEGVR